jgi:hypothetical protein
LAPQEEAVAQGDVEVDGALGVSHVFELATVPTIAVEAESGSAVESAASQVEQNATAAAPADSPPDLRQAAVSPHPAEDSAPDRRAAAIPAVLVAAWICQSFERRWQDDRQKPTA